MLVPALVSKDNHSSGFSLSAVCIVMWRTKDLVKVERVEARLLRLWGKVDPAGRDAIETLF